MAHSTQPTSAIGDDELGPVAADAPAFPIAVAIVGGVTIVVTTEPIPDVPPAPDPQKPCPVVLGAPLRVLGPLAAADDKAVEFQLGRAPREPARGRNRQSDRRHTRGCLVHLEHLGGLAFDGPVYNLGTVAPGAGFLYVWEVETESGPPADYPVTIVAQAAKYEPLRLRSSIPLIDVRRW